MATKERIVQVAKTYFAQHGYENTSLDLVSNHLNITKPALYYHYKNKKQIYNEIFVQSFMKLSIDEVKTLEDYIFKLAEFFENDKEIAKLFSMELALEARHLEDKTLKLISKTLQKLITILDDNINPMFIQTVIMSSLTTYLNTINLRNRVSNMIQKDNISFSIKEDLYKMLSCYLKGKK